MEKQLMVNHLQLKHNMVQIQLKLKSKVRVSNQEKQEKLHHLLFTLVIRTIKRDLVVQMSLVSR